MHTVHPPEPHTTELHPTDPAPSDAAGRTAPAEPAAHEAAAEPSGGPTLRAVADTGPGADHAERPITGHDQGRTLPARLVVLPWYDPDLALRGVDPRSDYVERYLTGLVGPSVVLLARRLARGLAEHPAGFSIAPSDTARAIGLSGGLGPNAPMSRTLERACLFGLMRRPEPHELHMRTHLPLLTPRQLRRLPLAVRASHQHWLTQHRPSRPPAA